MLFRSVRHCIEATWLNDRDQFLFPIEGWKTDYEFQNDCLAFALFHGQNKISSSNSINHFIPFSECEIDSYMKFDSNFMSNYIAGKCDNKKISTQLFDKPQIARTSPLIFSMEANSVFEAGKELWKYYHKQPNCNVNASLYDIREHFQSRNATGIMNKKSSDKTYMILITDLRTKLKLLASKIEPKVFDYMFLKV